MSKHDFLEIATEIVDKYWKEKPEKFPNPYLLEKDISDALSLQYQKGREAGIEESAKVAENITDGTGCRVSPGTVATTIRNLSKEKA